MINLWAYQSSNSDRVLCFPFYSWWYCSSFFIFLKKLKPLLVSMTITWRLITGSQRYDMASIGSNGITSQELSSAASWETIFVSAWLLIFSQTVPSLHCLSLNLVFPPNRTISYLSRLFHCLFTWESAEHGLWKWAILRRSPVLLLTVYVFGKLA